MAVRPDDSPPMPGGALGTIGALTGAGEYGLVSLGRSFGSDPFYEQAQQARAIAIQHAELYGSNHEKVSWYKESFREELQAETNEWLKDIK